MYCRKCGKQISDQARFCNSCGAPVTDTQPYVPQQTAQTAQTEKKGSGFGNFFIILVLVGIFFLVRTVAYNATVKDQSTPPATQTNLTGTIALTTTSLEDAMVDCMNGALYEDGYLRYGFAKLSLPDYTLQLGAEGEEDYLLSSDGYSFLSVSKHLEIMEASFEATTEEDLLTSTRNTYPDATMVDFQKYQINDAYVIRYIVRYTDGGTELYFGEAILMPSETCSQTIRLIMAQYGATGYDRITQAFDSLRISPDYAPTYNETNVSGYTRIAAK